jgi:hypothetical protein
MRNFRIHSVKNIFYFFYFRSKSIDLHIHIYIPTQQKKLRDERRNTRWN